MYKYDGGHGSVDVDDDVARGAKVPPPPAGHKWKEVRHDNTVSLNVYLYLCLSEIRVGFWRLFSFIEGLTNKTLRTFGCYV